MAPITKQALAEKIRALLSKTVENGCTEAEAMLAAEKARQLMDKHNLDLSALDVEAEGAERRIGEKQKKYRGVDIAFKMSPSIGRFTDVKIFGSNGSLHFIGAPSDVDFAEWLSSSLATFVMHSAALYQLNALMEDNIKLGKFSETSFIDGAIHRINERLNALSRERDAKAPQTSDGKSLVPIKQDLIARKMAELGIRLQSRSNTYAGQGSSHFGAGQAAGNRASFGRPVSSVPRNMRLTGPKG